MCQVAGAMYKSPFSGRLYLYIGKLNDEYSYKIVVPGPRDHAAECDILRSKVMMHWLVPDPEAGG